MPVLYEVVELANGDIALQREGDDKGQPLVTMRFSTELLRFLRNGKLDIAKIMIEAGLEEVAKLAADFTEQETPAQEKTVTSQQAGPQGAEQPEATKAESFQVDAATGASGQAFSPGGSKSAESSTRNYRESATNALKVERGNETLAKKFPHQSAGERRSSPKTSATRQEEDLLEAEVVSHLIH